MTNGMIYEATSPHHADPKKSFSHREKGSSVYMPSCSLSEIFFSYRCAVLLSMFRIKINVL